MERKVLSSKETMADIKRLIPDVEVFKNDSFRMYINNENELILLSAYGKETNLGKIKYNANDWGLDLFEAKERVKGTSPFIPQLEMFLTARFKVDAVGGVGGYYVVYEIDEDNSSDYTIAYKVYEELGERGK